MPEAAGGGAPSIHGVSGSTIASSSRRTASISSCVSGVLTEWRTSAAEGRIAVVGLGQRRICIATASPDWSSTSASISSPLTIVSVPRRPTDVTSSTQEFRSMCIIWRMPESEMPVR